MRAFEKQIREEADAILQSVLDDDLFQYAKNTRAVKGAEDVALVFQMQQIRNQGKILQQLQWINDDLTEIRKEL